MISGEVEEKFGKVYTRLGETNSDVALLKNAVFGNGVPGHEKRIKDMEDCLSKRRETCPFVSDKKNRYMAIGVWINAGVMLVGFISLFLAGS